MAVRRPNRRAIKQHYSYTSEEAARVLGVSKGTVRRWMKDGLPCLTDQRPFLILGTDLRDFLKYRNRPRQTCQLNECFCFRCQREAGVCCARGQRDGGRQTPTAPAARLRRGASGAQPPHRGDGARRTAARV